MSIEHLAVDEKITLRRFLHVEGGRGLVTSSKARGSQMWFECRLGASAIIYNEVYAAEGVDWIRGWHEPDSQAIRALQAAHALMESSW